MTKYKLWERELPDLKTKKRKDLIPMRRGSVRLRAGLFYLEDEYEDLRKEADKPLP